MHRTQAVFLSAAVVTLAVAATAVAQQRTAPRSDSELIANALSAAPGTVADTAAVVAMDPGGKMRTVRPGTGAFTCVPDNPATPGNDPMCADKNGMDWVKAWMNHQTPPSAKVGLIYMLQGGSDASNDDPFATTPKPGQKWVDTGPHVMVVGATSMMEGYPKTAADPRSPYVMWSGTPYAHIMVPVGEPKQPSTAQLPDEGR